ncbi:MAG TPA: hypothetical protein VK742_03365 [Candidatus Sulfotelmatobacter sp.]|jgi:hypothetical protein|nr:hypothetical protein [Candidatus Sulfotelmatobacter sp.]
MRNIILTTLAGGAVCLLAGCETDGLSVRERGTATYPNYILSLPAAAPNAAPQKIRLPARIAVAQVGEDAPSQALLDQLAADKVHIADVVALPMPGEPLGVYYNRVSRPVDNYSGQVQTICNLARAAGAEKVFLVGGNIDSWQESSFWSVLDFTVVGAFVVPACEINLEGKGAGALIDVTTGVPEIFVSASATNSAAVPDILAGDKTPGLQAKMRNELATKLGSALLQKLADQN